MAAGTDREQGHILHRHTTASRTHYVASVFDNTVDKMTITQGSDKNNPSG